MAFLSPGIEIRENTTQSTVVQNATGRAAIAGKFQWGPAYQAIQITNEVELVEMFGLPDVDTADYFMSSANFLQYGNDLRVVRAVNEAVAKNSSPIAGNIKTVITAPGSNYQVGDKVTVKYTSIVVEDGGKVTKVDADGKILSVFIPSQKIIAYAKSIAQFPDLSDSWTVEITSAASGISGAITVESVEVDSGILLTDPDNSIATITGVKFQEKIKTYNMPGIVALFPGEIGDQLEVEVVSRKDYASTTPLQIYPTGGTRHSQASAVFGYAPQTDDQYALIVRRNGEVVESFIVSTKKEDKDIYGGNIYMDEFFARGSSRYIFATAQGFPKDFSGIIKLSGGVSANAQVSAGDLMKAWDLFADAESLHVNLMIAGSCAGEDEEVATTVQKHVVSLADERRDCLVLVSYPRSTMVNIDLTRAVDNIIDCRAGAGAYTDANLNVNSTYAFMDGNYKYQYDKYNDVNRWVPLAADIAGLCARTDDIAQPWMSPAGYVRGQILNCIKLAIEPRKSHRDRMYQVGINPVIASNSGGFLLFGDKTATTVPSPFDRVNVRRLFNMLKKNIGDSSKYRLFEINDAFTRSSFRMETTQYIAGIKALGGVYDFKVVCDETNNTPSVIDRNEFVATFYIKPARAINYIALNFVATATGADFDELIGRQ